MDKLFISPHATYYMKILLSKNKLNTFRIIIKNGGLYGLKYDIQPTSNNICKDCIKYTMNDIPLLTCKQNDMFIDGLCIDYKKKFVIINKNATYNNKFDNSFSFLHNY